MSVPDANACVETAGYNTMTVECYGIYLTEMPTQSVQTTPFRYAPNLGSCIVAPGDHNVAFDL